MANTESREDSPINDQWIDIIADELVTRMSTDGESFSTKSTTGSTKSTTGDDEIFYETERDLADEDDLQAATQPAESLFVEVPVRTSGQEKGGDKPQQGDSISKEAKEDKETHTTHATGTAVDGEMDLESKAEDFYDANMPERRSKRERMSLSKESSSSSFVTRLKVRMESNQKAKRKEKRERKMEKKKEKMKKT
jgi:hypothetical protein